MVFKSVSSTEIIHREEKKLLEGLSDPTGINLLPYPQG